VPGSTEPQRTTHFTGTVRLSTTEPQLEHAEVVKEDAPILSGSRVYDFYFHGPAYQVVGSSWRHNGGNAARLADALPDDHAPMDVPTVAAPRLVELCFQTAGLWEAAHDGRLALPRHVGAVRVLRDPALVTGPLYAVASQVEDHFDCSVRNADGDIVVIVEGYGTTALPVPLPDDIHHDLSEVLAQAGPA
jgi:hypothetical protein